MEHNMKNIINKIKRLPDYLLNKVLAVFWKKRIEKPKVDRSKKKLTISHITWHFCGNAGDNILSLCVRKFYEKCFENYNIQWSIIPVVGEVTDKTIETINKSDICVIGGGGLFLPDTNPNNKSGWQWAISSEQLNLISTPISIFAVGYNYFPGQKMSELSKKGIIDIVRKSSFAGFRNQGSVLAIKTLLPPELEANPVYQPCPTTIINNLFGISHQIGQTKTIGINMAFDRIEMRLGTNYREKLRQVAKAAFKISELGIKIVYMAHCSKDMMFLDYLLDENVKYELRRLWNRNPEKAMQSYLDIDVMLGMRGHAQMVPFGIGCGIVTLGSHDKMRWFMQDTELEGAYIDMNQDDLYDIIFKVVSDLYLCDSPTIFESIKQAQSRLLEVSESNAEHIKGLVGGLV